MIEENSASVVYNDLVMEKVKKTKLNVVEAAAKINSSELVAFLLDITERYDTKQEIQLMRLADYFGAAFSKVSTSKFPWIKILKASSVAKMADVPLSNLPEDVYKVSVDWLNHLSSEALGSFILWSLDNLIDDLFLHQGATKRSNKVVQQATSRSQVAIFMVLAMILRCQPDVLISLLPILKENPKYEGEDKLPVLVWLIIQVCQSDLVDGMFMWAHFLFPKLKSNFISDSSTDLILQVVEWIISFPRARAILVNGSVRKGERLVPVSVLELLIRVAFPDLSARSKATERFQAVYPTLKEVAIAVTPGSEEVKHITQKIMMFTIKAAGEGIPDLSQEASDLFVWCLTQNPACCQQLDNIYLEHLEGSVILKKLSDEWKTISYEHPTLDTLKESLRNFPVKNEKVLLSSGVNAADQESLKDAEKHCKMLLRRVSDGPSPRCIKSFLLVTIAVAVVAALLLY
ncbi:Hypothetical predicted protein [Olea europaea subsp. europaea]|uniref:Uncharacterized protein n=1 Tax=Olea europaea subsp. europaea TaxID=158383 RepID=A0A8S0UY87_OLEEU|nr:Hypothetical predicted protein [Olea europaea subsp. europaea]